LEPFIDEYHGNGNLNKTFIMENDLKPEHRPDDPKWWVSVYLEKLQKTNRKAIVLYISDFKPEGLHAEILKEFEAIGMKIRRLQFSKTVSNCSNSDGEGCWDEQVSYWNYFLTKAT
jgi:hypothetical protein